MMEVTILPDQRIMELKQVLEDIHKGKSISEVQEKYYEVIRNVSSADIAEMEGLLVQDGIKVEEIQMFCDLHLSVFKETLDESEAVETIPGHPVFTFLAENRAAEELLYQISDELKNYFQKPDDTKLILLQKQTIILKTFEVHYLRKTKILFPFLQKHGMVVPLNVMESIQEKILEDLRCFYDLVLSLNPADNEKDAGGLLEIFKKLKNDMKDMFFKEAGVLFPNAVRLLNKKEWGEILAREAEIGYFRVLPRIKLDNFQTRANRYSLI